MGDGVAYNSVVGNGVGNKGSVGNDGSVGNKGSVGNNGVGLDQRSGVTVSTLGSLGVDRGTLVGDLGDETVVVVGGVGGGLDPAVGEGDHKGSLHIALSVLGLGLLEVGLGVVIVDTVLVGERLGGELLLVHDGGTVGGGTGGESHGKEGGGDNKLKLINNISLGYIRSTFRKKIGVSLFRIIL